jgi:hypothetical protein
MRTLGATAWIGVEPDGLGPGGSQAAGFRYDPERFDELNQSWSDLLYDAEG